VQEISPRPNQRHLAHASPDANRDIEYILSPESEELRLGDYLKMLLKRRRLVVGVLVAALGIGAFITFLTPPQYTASVTIKIDEGTPAQGFGEMMAAGDDYYQTQVALLKSRGLAAKVITNLGLESNPKFVVVRTPLEQLSRRVTGFSNSALTYVSDLISTLLGSTPAPEEPPPAVADFAMGVHPRFIGVYQRLFEVQPVPKTSLVRVLFTTADPRLSQELAAAHAATFIRMNLETRFDLTKEAREFLEKKLSDAKLKVMASEQAIQRFRQRHGVVSLEGHQNVIVERMVDLNRRLTESRAKRIELESLSRIVKGRDIEYLSEVIANNLIQQLRVRLEGLEAEQARLATIFKPDHPRLVELKQQISQARRRLSLEINNVVRGIESDYSAARARENALQAEADSQQQAALDLKNLGVQHAILQGELDTSRGVLESISKRINETTISSDSPISNIQVVEPAERPLVASSPQAMRNLLLALALGLFSGVSLALLLEHLDSTMRTPQDVWRAVAVPTLGVVPHLKSLARLENGFGRFPRGSPPRRLTHHWASAAPSGASALMVSYHPLSLLAESYRVIRTGLLLGQAEGPPQVILLTSAQPGEGKTTITLNLAITLAQSGRTVIVVDADLRKGNCHLPLGIQNRHGLTQILAEGMPLEEGVQPTAVPGLSFLPRGAVSANPADLLDSSKMKEMLAVLRERFDFILIDTPPALAISDAAVLSVLCDGVLLVLRNQSTTADSAQRVIERLQAVGARILGAVLNGINIRDPDYADYRHYYSSYHAAAQNREQKQGRW
jgi:succinoglycan biosynthesis transport protein ExoP